MSAPSRTSGLESPAAAAPVSAFSGKLRVLLWTLIVLGWAQLFFTTLDIHEANLDDLGFHRVALAGKRLEYTNAWGPIQGRHYAYFAFTPIWALDAITNPWLHQIARLGLVLVPLLLLARLAHRVTVSADLALLWFLVWTGSLQIPPTFYGLLSYSYLHFGLAFVLLGAHRFWTGLTSASPAAPRWSAGVLFFIGLQFHEAFLAFTLLFGLLWIWRTPQPEHRPTLRALLPIACAAAAYLVLYFGYRAAHPPVYEGAQAGANIAGMLVYASRYACSSLPGFELVINRTPGAPLLLPWSEISARLATVNTLHVLVVLVYGGAIAWALQRAEWRLKFWRSLLLAACTVTAGFAFIMPPALSGKYQSYVFHRHYPHAYNFTYVHFLWLGLVIFALGLLSALPPAGLSRRLGAGLLGVAFGVAALLAQVTNPIAVQEMKRIVNTFP